MWKCPRLARGRAIDEALNKHSQNEGLGENFPVFDRLDRITRELISTKSMDLTIQSYRSDTGVTRMLNRYLKNMYEFELNWRWYLMETKEQDKAIKTDFRWSESRFVIGEYDTKVLELALPDNEPISIGVYNALNNAIINFETTEEYANFKNKLQAIKETEEKLMPKK